MSSVAPSTAAAQGTKSRSWFRRGLRWLFLFAVIPYLAIVAILGVAQRSLIYHPRRTGPLRAQSISEPNARISDLKVPVDAKMTLHGWQFHCSKPDSGEGQFLLIYFGGNAGCRADRIQDCRDFTELDCDVVLFDYRGYGDNDGSPSEAALAADAQRVWSFVTDELHYPAERIIIFGESLGGAVATRLASERSLAGDPPAALILNSTFASLVETAAWHYPLLPVRWLLIDRFPSVQRIADLKCPLLQFHGTGDTIVPFAQGERLFNAAPSHAENSIEKRFVKIPGGQHNFIYWDQMQLAIAELLKQLDAKK